MVTISITCPHCSQSDAVRRYGTNRSGTPRCYCNTCRCAFTLNPKPRRLDEEKATLIRHALEKQTPVSTICRMFKVSPKTVYALMRGSRVILFLVFGLEENFWKRDPLTPRGPEKIRVSLNLSETTLAQPAFSPSMFSGA